MTDKKLIELFLKGDITAFNRLVWRWEKPLFNFVYRIVGNKETTKDICQMTFIRMFKQLKKLRDLEKFSSWIYRIALNLCRDEFKKKRNNHIVYLDELLSDEESINSIGQLPDKNSKTPEETYHQKQISELLKRAILLLPEEQKVVLIMKQYQGLKFTEIAEILKEPLSTIKSRLYYGLRSLRKILEESKLNEEALSNEL